MVRILYIWFISIFLLLAQKPTVENVTELYVATFDRVPDKAGLNYWLYDSNLELEGIASSFFDQPETQEKYPKDTTTEEFIISVYNNLFDRDPQSEGLQYWKEELENKNISRSNFILAVINGALGDDANILKSKRDKALAELGYIEANRFHLLIPLYTYPDIEDSNGVWQRVIELKRSYPDIDIVAIANQSNGDFDHKSNSYAQAIPMLVENGIKVIGYVYTGYGNRDIDDVKTNIDSWLEYYKDLGIEGIFFDEVSDEKEDLDYYKELSEYAKSNGMDFVVLNPGTTTDKAYFDANIADVIVSYENPYRSWRDNLPSTLNEPTKNTKLSLLIYEMEGDKTEELFNFAKENNFDYLYFTEDGFDGNPWDSLSEYTEELLEYIESQS